MSIAVATARGLFVITACAAIAALGGCAAGEGERCGKPEDCARGLTCAGDLHTCAPPPAVASRVAELEAELERLKREHEIAELKRQLEELDSEPDEAKMLRDQLRQLQAGEAEGRPP